MKCKNCGAELNNGKCEYCGSVFWDTSYIIPNIQYDEEQIREIVKRTPIVKSDIYMHKAEIRSVYV